MFSRPHLIQQLGAGVCAYPPNYSGG
jgi:hypothetical protein